MYIPPLKAQNDYICSTFGGAWPPGLPWLRLCVLMVSQRLLR